MDIELHAPHREMSVGDDELHAQNRQKHLKTSHRNKEIDSLNSKQSTENEKVYLISQIQPKLFINAPFLVVFP